MQVLVYLYFTVAAMVLVLAMAWAFSVIVKHDERKHTTEEKKAIDLYGFVPKVIRKNQYVIWFLLLLLIAYA